MRGGEDLERLVAVLEGILGPTGIKVRSPERIRGKRSKASREIDVSLRGSVGSTSILVIAECRDRSGVEDVTWIEQLATKRDDVGADKAIAVSSSSFTEGARNLAEGCGIELRTLEEVDSAAVLSWVGIKELVVHKMGAELDTLEIGAISEDGSDVEKWPVSDSFIFQEGDKERTLTSWDLWMQFSTDDVYRGVPTDGTKQPFGLVTKVWSSDPAVRLQIAGPNGARAEVGALAFNVQLWIELERVPLSAISRYMGPGGTLAENAHFELEMEGERLRVTLHHVPEKSGMGVSITPKTR